MFNVKYLLLSGLLLFVQAGCNGVTPAPNPPSEEQQPTLVGIGLEKSKELFYPTAPKGSFYYGQVIIEPTVTKKMLSGPEAQTLFSHIATLFHEKKESFGLSVTPIIDGHRLPDIVLFTYTYDSSTQQWRTTLNEAPRTAMTLLKAGTELSFELKYTSIDQKSFNFVREITKSIYGGNILISAVSLPAIDIISDRVSEKLSSAVSSSTTLYFSPVSDAKKSVTYSVKTKNNEELAKVKFSLLLKDSIVSGTTIDDSQINKIPTISSTINPLTQVYTHIDDTLTLNDRLNREESILTFSQIKEPIAFRDKCQDIQNRLETYGLNILDSYSAFANILERTNFLKDRKLFDSGCLSQSELEQMQQMGILLPPPPKPKPIHVTIDDDVLTNLGRYMLNPIANVGFKSDLLKLFSETVLVQSSELIAFSDLYIEDDEVAMTPHEFMKRLGEIGVARYGNYSRQEKDYRYFLFRPLSSNTIYRIKLKRERSWGRIRTVVIEPWDDDKIAPNIQRRLRRVASSSVLGHEKDILRQKNQIELALKE